MVWVNWLYIIGVAYSGRKSTSAKKSVDSTKNWP